jgi:hypothetical protein
MKLLLQVLIERYGYSDDPTYDSLLHKLGVLAGEWRETKAEDTCDQYATVLRTLLLMSWRGELPVDIELPDRLMPVEYLAQFE